MPEQITFDDLAQTDATNTENQTKAARTVAGHPVNEITDVHGDDLLVCVECGNATLAESPANLGEDPCESGDFLPHPSTDE